MSHPTPALRGISMSTRQLEGLRSSLLEAMTSGEFGPSEQDLAVALRDGLAERLGIDDDLAAHIDATARSAGT